MNMPGFTAEMSLYKTSNWFEALDNHQMSKQTVIPQQFLCLGLAIVLLAEPAVIFTPWFLPAVFRYCRGGSA